MKTPAAVSSSRRFVGVTFGEFAAWYASGETRLLRARLVDVAQIVERSEPGIHDASSVRMLMHRIPPLSLDDEEGVLIVRLAIGQLADDEEDSQLVRISMDRVEGVVPLTSRARQILIGRLEAYGIAPEEAWFEKEFRALSYKRRIASSIRAGNDFVSIFARDGQLGHAINLEVPASAALALMDFEGSIPGPDAQAIAPETWVSCAFGWTRHKPYDFGELNHLYDAGAVLRQLQQKNGSAIGTHAVDGFRNMAKSIVDRLGHSARIKELLADGEFVSAGQTLQVAAPVGSSRVDLQACKLEYSIVSPK